MWLLTFYAYNHYIGSALCLPISLLLFYLIYNKTNSCMRPLSLVILQTSIVDLIASLIFTFSQAQMEVSNGFLFTRSPAPWNVNNRSPQCFHPILYGLTYQIALASMPIQCLYRYFLIFKKQPPPVFTPVIVYILSFLFMLPSAIYNYTQNSAASEVPGAIEAFNQLGNWRNTPNVSTTFCAMKVLQSANIIYIFCLIVGSNICFLIMIFTSIRIHRHLVQTRIHFSARTVEIQNQLGKRLIVQSIIPCFCAINIIVITTISFVLTKYDGGIFLLIFMPYPYFYIVNPLSTILCIRSYRKGVVEIFKRDNNVSFELNAMASVHPQRINAQKTFVALETPNVKP